MEIQKIEKHEDERGIIFGINQQIINFNYKDLTIGTIEPNSVRGGHYHYKNKEKLMCIKGQIIMILNNEVAILNPGDIIDIPVKCIHTLRNQTSSTAIFIEFNSEIYDPNNNDTYKK